MLRAIGILLVVAIGITFLSGMAFSEPVKFDLGANGAWLDGPNAAWPNDIEVGATAHSSLSPHISLVGGTFYGFRNSYLRWDGGARVTVTDVDNRNFNMYLGARYRGGSEASVRPGEFAPDAGFGWRPAASLPRLTLGADVGYGVESNRVLAIVAARWNVPLK